MNTMLDWKQREGVDDGTVIGFEYRGLTIWFEMPKGYKFPHPRALRLAEWLMLSPWHDIPEEREIVNPGHYGDTPALSYSGGVDSTAALQVMPKNTVSVYCERAGVASGSFNQVKQTAVCDRIGAIRIPTNFELIRTVHGEGIGYSTARGMGVPAVLLAEHYGLSGVAYGAVLDDTCFPHGTFRPFTKDYHARQKRFTDAGLHCLSPVIGCSEVITSTLVENGPHSKQVFSCIRGTDSEPCGACYKCYRKTMLRGKKLETTPEIDKALAYNPPKMAGPMIYAARLAGANLKELDYAKGKNLWFLRRYYRENMAILPDNIRNCAEAALARAGIEPMMGEDVETMKATDFRRPEAAE